MLCEFSSKGFPSIIYEEVKVKDYLSLSDITQFSLQTLSIYLLHIHKDYLESVQKIFNYKIRLSRNTTFSLSLPIR